MGEEAMTRAVHDPDEYARRSAPHATDAEAEAAVAAFLRGVETLRRSLRIADVVVVAEAVRPDGERFGMGLSRGDSRRAIEMAYAMLRSVTTATVPETEAMFAEAEREKTE